MWKYNAADIGIDDDPDPLCHCVIRNSGTQCISFPFILHFVSCGNANVCECKWWVVESGTVGGWVRFGIFLCNRVTQFGHMLFLLVSSLL